MRVAARVALMAVCLVAGGCPVLVSPDPGVAGEGAACGSETPCAAGLSCVDGSCRPDATSSSSSGGSSGSSGGMDAGLPPECSIRLECALDGRIDGRDCVDGRCVFIECADDDACGSRACVEGRCADVVTCEGDRDCDAQSVCEEGRCVPACQDDAECNAGGLPINTCNDGRCRQRCFGDQTCLLAGGICVGNVCVPPECSADADCDSEDLECVDQRCVPFTPCESDAVCLEEGPGRVCGDEGRCRQLDACARDADCGGTGVCTSGYCVPAAACGMGGTACPEGTECVGGLCVSAAECRGNEDCTAPLLCRAGTCAMPSTAAVARVLIVSPAGTCDPVLDTRAACEISVRPGDQVALTAIALDAAGRLVAGVAAEWTSDVTDVADVMAGPSSVTVLGGGTMAGGARITARASGRTSPALLVRNLGDNAAAVRVRVVDAGTGTALTGAVVRVGTVDKPVDAQGVATFDAAEVTAPFTVTAYAADHDYVTLWQLPGPVVDALVPLPAAEPLQVAAGLRGTVNLSNVASTGPVSFALAGVSAPSVPGLSFSRLLGETFSVEVSLPVVGSQRVPLPGGITLSAELPVIGQQDIKTEFHALGSGGRRMAWAFGGRLPLTAVQGLVGLQGGAQAALFALAPFFEGLTHGLQTGLALTDLPYVRDGDTEFDGEEDINGNGNEDEQVPDYAAFPQTPLTVRQEQVLRTEVRVNSALPGQVLLVAGARVPGHGFVPLGMTSATPANGAVAQVMKLAPRYGGLEAGDYAVAAFAFGQGGALSLRTTGSDVLPTTVSMGSLPAFPTAGTYTAGTRALAFGGVSGTDVVHGVVGGGTGRWHVYAAPADGMNTLVIPGAPAGLSDHAQRGAYVEGMQLGEALRSNTDPVGALAAPGTSGLTRAGQEAEGVARASLQTR